MQQAWSEKLNCRPHISMLLDHPSMRDFLGGSSVTISASYLQIAHSSLNGSWQCCYSWNEAITFDHLIDSAFQCFPDWDRTLMLIKLLKFTVWKCPSQTQRSHLVYSSFTLRGSACHAPIVLFLSFTDVSLTRISSPDCVWVSFFLKQQW